jgi:3-oxoacyl-[acyl-carrier protein] reductase
MTFKERTAIVTGAGRGIGKGIAEVLAANGVSVICVSKSESSCGAVAAAITAAGGKARAMAVDVSDGAAISAAAETLLKEFGKIDILVNNAGITRDGLLLRMSEEDWHQRHSDEPHQLLSTGRRRPRLPMCRVALDGRIVNIASVVRPGGQCRPGQLCRGQGRDDRRLRNRSPRSSPGGSVTANVVAPGFIKTDMTATLSGRTFRRPLSNSMPAAAVRRSGGHCTHGGFSCLGRGWLYVTGQVFTVDGGMAI